jgi:hypothetical protein
VIDFVLYSRLRGPTVGEELREVYLVELCHVGAVAVERRVGVTRGSLEETVLVVSRRDVFGHDECLDLVAEVFASLHQPIAGPS